MLLKADANANVFGLSECWSTKCKRVTTASSKDLCVLCLISLLNNFSKHFITKAVSATGLKSSNICTLCFFGTGITIDRRYFCCWRDRTDTRCCLRLTSVSLHSIFCGISVCCRWFCLVWPWAWGEASGCCCCGLWVRWVNMNVLLYIFMTAWVFVLDCVRCDVPLCPGALVIACLLPGVRGLEQFCSHLDGRSAVSPDKLSHSGTDNLPLQTHRSSAEENRLTDVCENVFTVHNMAANCAAITWSDVKECSLHVFLMQMLSVRNSNGGWEDSDQ